MTFASATVRILYHQLPTETQVRYADMENRLAGCGQRLQIEGVMQHDNILEIVIRITHDFKVDTSSGSARGNLHFV